MDVVDLETGMLLQDQVAIGGALVVERIIRHRRECRLQRGETFQRGLRPRILLLVEREAAVLAINRHEALVEITIGDRVRRPLLAFQPEPVDILSRDAFQRRHRVGADALMRLRMPGAQA